MVLFHMQLFVGIVDNAHYMLNFNMAFVSYFVSCVSVCVCVCVRVYICVCVCVCVCV